jgi:hypothetical protein
MLIRTHRKKPLRTIMTFVLTFTLALWSWNVIGDLAGLPEAELRHAVAATILLALGRWLISDPEYSRQERRCGNEH